MKNELRVCKVLYFFDVWGNARDGFEVQGHDHFTIELDLTNNRTLLTDLRAEFNLPKYLKVVDNGSGLEVTYRNGQPILYVDYTTEVELESTPEPEPEPIAPILKALKGGRKGPAKPSMFRPNLRVV